MKKLVVALVAIAFATPASAQDIAPAVKRKPAATSAAPAAASTAPAAPQQTARSGNERDYVAALTAAAGQGDAALDTSLIRVMSRLMSAGRCGEAVSLASRDGRKELASRARQLCQ